MECREFRSRLVGKRNASEPDLATHRTECSRCQQYARRWDLIRQGIGQPAEEHSGDPAFAARVLASLPRAPELLGWAALRALPAALLLALVLAGLGAAELPPPVSLLFDEPSSNQLLAWSVQGSGDSR